MLKLHLFFNSVHLKLIINHSANVFCTCYSFCILLSNSVRDLEGGPNCRVSECQGFITKQRYKRVVMFACDLTTRTE